MMEKIIIAAVADNRAIGKDNRLLWHISEDLKFFKKNTSDTCVIMGRRTYESLGRPLPKRLAEKEAPESGMHQDRCFVIGGGQIYSAAMEVADKLILTHVHTNIEDADTFFPEINPTIWEVEDRSEMMHDELCGLDYEFVTYKRHK